MSGVKADRPDGWEWTHEHQWKLIERDGLMCEAHPGLPFEHDPECPGPGMPWMVEGRAAIEAFASASARAPSYQGIAEMLPSVLASGAGQKFWDWLGEHMPDASYGEKMLACAAWRAALEQAEREMPPEHGDSDWEEQRNGAIRELLAVLARLAGREVGDE